MSRSSAAFLVLGIVFVFLGLGSHTGYIGIGAAFIVMALVARKRNRAS